MSQNNQQLSTNVQQSPNLEPRTSSRLLNAMLWFLVLSSLIFQFVDYSKKYVIEILDFQQERMILYFWTPSDTVSYSEEYEQLHSLLLKETGAWTRTRVEGAWIDKTDTQKKVYREEGFLYTVSVFSKKYSEITSLKNTIEKLIKSGGEQDKRNPTHEIGFGQIESYVELIKTEK